MLLRSDYKKIKMSENFCTCMLKNEEGIIYGKAAGSDS